MFSKSAGYGLPGIEQTSVVLGVELGKRNNSAGKKLSKQLQLFYIAQVCSDSFPVYPKIVQHPNRLIIQAETWGVESLNSRINHYLARFRFKTFYYSRALHRGKAALTLFSIYPVICNASILNVLNVNSTLPLQL